MKNTPTVDFEITRLPGGTCDVVPLTSSGEYFLARTIGFNNRSIADETHFVRNCRANNFTFRITNHKK